MTKRLLVVAGALLLMATALPGTVEAQTPPPHKDPSAEAAEFNPISALEYFGTIVGLLAQGNYDNAQGLPEQLQHAHIPEDLRFIIDRYRGLLGNLSNELDFTESSLREASASLDRGDHPEARQQLQAAGSSLKKAKRLLEDLQVSTETVARRLGVFGTPAVDPLRKAYEQLQALLTRLDELWAQYAANLEQLEAAAEAAETLETSAGNATPASPLIYQTELRFEIGSPSYPGQVTPIVWEVTAVDGPNPARVFLRVLLDQDLIASFSTTAAFEQDIEIPATALLGQHVLTVELPPQGRYAGTSASKEVELFPQGRYAGTSASKDLEIVQASSHLTVRSPLVTFLPRSIPVSGEVTSVLGPLRNAKVTLRLGESQTQLQTDDQGQFSGSVDLSLSNFFPGLQTLDVAVEPAEPMYGVLTQRVNLLIINATNLAILAMVALCIPSALTMVWRKQNNNQTFTASGRPEIPMPSSAPGVSVFPAPLPAESWAYTDTGGPRGRVVLAYHSAAQFLEFSLEKVFPPSFTLRKFLISIGSRASTAFVDLTGLAERALYATQPIDEEEARRAEGLAKAVQEEVG
jgi:hypothetical protein